ncbi:EAL domain-containing protein [Clostridium sp. DL1XJH146]
MVNEVIGCKNEYVNTNFGQPIIQNHKFVMLIINPKTGEIVEGNNNAVSYYGYSKEELLSLRIQDINILKADEVKKEMFKVKSGIKNYFNFRHLLSNGEIRNVEVYSTLIKIEKKEYLHSIICDITNEREQSVYFDQCFMNTPIATVILNNDNRVIDINNSFYKLFKYNKEEILNKQLKEAITNDPLLKENIQDSFDKVNKGILINKKSERVTKDGQVISVDITAFPIINNGRQIGKVATFIDITEKKEKEKELKLFEKALAKNTEGITITDREGNIQWINNAFSKITGYTLQEAKGENPRILKSDRHSDEFYKNMWDCIIDRGNWQGEIYNKNKEGHVYPEFLNICAIKDDNDSITHFIAIFNDITEHKIRDKKIENLIYRDSLTGLYSRSFFMDNLEREVLKANNNTLAVIFLDLDDFKKINDTLGHSIGDIVLIEIADRITRCVSDKDIVARIGGDEFTIVIPKIKNEKETIVTSNKIIKIVEEPIFVDNNDLHISASIGIAIYDNNTDTAEVLMKCADIAMYKSKENKGNNENRVVLFNSDMNKDIDEKFILGNDLMNSLEKKQLYLNYQPIINIQTHDIIATEALIRWKHPELGIIPPDKFIYLAEKSGVINKIGLWVLRTACMQNKQWQMEGTNPIVISVNVSVVQLKQKNFPSLVEEVLKETKLDAKYLELEIVESISMENIDDIKKTLNSLNKLGVNIVIDDFGTGYSSLAELNNLAISKLKIDKKFIDDIEKVQKSRRISEAIVAVAKSLDIKVVAEGIETKEQLSILKGISCDYGQGYYFSRPVDSDSIKKMILLEK